MTTKLGSNTADVLEAIENATVTARNDNDAAVVLSADCGTLMVDLSAIILQAGKSSGKVSGYARIIVGGKSVGAVTIFAPADLTTDDKAQSNESKRLIDMATTAYRRGDNDAGKRFLDLADDAKKRYDAAVTAAKADWRGKSAQSAILAKSAQ